MQTENYNQFKKRIANDKKAYDLIMIDYFTSHSDYNEKTNRLESVI